ncbi:MAG: SDR family oxidoreductase [Bacteroidetes bacterium]|nr:SDR family oxidoreductase [Bacteroidota bacterium]
MEMIQKILNGKVAVITGASSGIGKAIAKRFANEGAHVVIASRDIVKGQDVVNEIVDSGNNAIFIQCDVRREEDIKFLFEETMKKYQYIDIVVANAGISGGKERVIDYDLTKWSDVLQTNLTGAFLTMREGFKSMVGKGGHIIAISSQAGIEGYAGKGAYCASKFGVRGLAHALAEEGRAFNINVSTICPGTTDTPILKASQTNVQNPMNVDAVADAAIYLATLRGNALVRDIVLERMILQ